MKKGEGIRGWRDGDLRYGLDLCTMAVNGADKERKKSMLL